MVVTKNPKSSILCVPDMDTALLDVLGFPCQCLAVVDEQSDIWSWSTDTSKQFPLPKSFKKSKQPVTDRMEIDVEPAVKRPVTDEIDVSALHLHKENTNSRAFIPGGAVFTKDPGNDFISLGRINLNVDNIRPEHQMISKDRKSETIGAKTTFKQNVVSEKWSAKHKMKPAHKQQRPHHNKLNYLPLKVNRIQANPDKIRNKNKKKNKKNKK